MKRGRLFVLLLLFCLVFVFIIGFVRAADISACGDLAADTSYTLTQSVSDTGTCFTAAGDNFVLDCQGYTITYGTDEGFALAVSGYHNITVKNCVVSEATDDYDFDFALYFTSSHNSTIQNNSITTKGYDARAIFLYESVNFSIANNTMVTPYGNSLIIFGNTVDHFNHSIDMSNTAEGSAVIYNFSLSNEVLYQNQNLSTTVGQLICGACDNVIYENVSMSKDGINLLYSNHSRVINSTVRVTQGHGINVESYSYNNSIMNNTVYTSGSNQYFKAIRICFHANHNTVKGNNITLDNAHGDGVYMRNYATDNLIINNTLATNGYQQYGVFIRGESHGNTVENNSIKGNENNSPGISWYNVSHNTAIDNDIYTGWQFSKGVMLEWATNCSIINNTFTTINSKGIHFQAGTNNKSYYATHNIKGNTENGKLIYYFANNNSITIEDLDNVGQIYIVNGTNVILDNITLIEDSLVFAVSDSCTVRNSFFNLSIDESKWCTYCNYYEGVISGHYSNNLNIDNNTIYAHGKGMYGVLMLYTPNTTLSNNKINTTGRYGDGIYVKDTEIYTFTRTTKSSYSLTFINNTILTTRDYAYGINFNSDTSLFKGNKITTLNITQAYGIYLENSTENEFYDNIINATNSSVIYSKFAGINNFTNCTFNQTNVSFHSSATAGINVGWYMDVFVNYSTGSIASDASVKAYNVNNSLTFTDTTDSTCYITRQNVTEYYQNKTKKYYQANYSINASYNSAYSETEQINLTENKINNNKIVLTINDTENPVAKITINPSSIVLEGSSTINCSGTDTNSSGLASVIVSSSENSSICSNSSCSGNSCSCQASSYVPTYVGIHTITCLVEDNAGNSNSVGGNLEVTQGSDGVGGSFGGGGGVEPPEEATEEIKEEAEEEKIEEEEEIIEGEKGIIQICKKNLLLCIFGILFLIILIITIILFISKKRNIKRKKFRFFK